MSENQRGVVRAVAALDSSASCQILLVTAIVTRLSVSTMQYRLIVQSFLLSYSQLQAVDIVDAVAITAVQSQARKA